MVCRFPAPHLQHVSNHYLDWNPIGEWPTPLCSLQRVPFVFLLIGCWVSTIEMCHCQEELLIQTLIQRGYCHELLIVCFVDLQFEFSPKLQPISRRILPGRCCRPFPRHIATPDIMQCYFPMSLSTMTVICNIKHITWLDYCDTSQCSSPLCSLLPECLLHLQKHSVFFLLV